MNDIVWTILISISVSVSVTLLAWDRGWLQPLAEILRHPVRTARTMAHNVKASLRG